MAPLHVGWRAVSNVVRKRVMVAGRVQGVGYRAACARVAAGLGVGGYVRNLEDGRVEVVAVGAVDAVERLIEWCRLGPRAAGVDQVVITDEPTADENAAERVFEVVR
jgi:acylphosphatase